MTSSRDLAKEGFRAVVIACAFVWPCMLVHAPTTVAGEPQPTGGSRGSASALSAGDGHGEIETGAKTKFGPVVHEISTSTPGGNKLPSVELVVSSEVHAVDRTGPMRFVYTYVFENKGGTTIKVTLVGAHLALSPLFELMQDFSLVLSAGEVKTFQFATASEPELSPATAYNVTRDEQRGEWKFVSSGAVSLYLPASLKPSYTFG